MVGPDVSIRIGLDSVPTGADGVAGLVLGQNQIIAHETNTAGQYNLRIPKLFL
jgi:hypothetical protein